MAKQTFPTAFELWKRHEKIYIGIFTSALLVLMDSQYDKSDEIKISETLCPILNNICFEESRKMGCEIPTPYYEAPIQPISTSELRGGKSVKRPDFTCTLTNSMALKADEYQLPFHIECKRLGFPTSRTWILNENYVVNGIMRYDSNEHEYGKRAFSGLMIGYIVSMDLNQILTEVNFYQRKHCAHNSEVEYQFTNNGVQQYLQKLNRRNLIPERFGLTHLWVNLR